MKGDQGKKSLGRKTGAGGRKKSSGSKEGGGSERSGPEYWHFLALHWRTVWKAHPEYTGRQVKVL